MPDTLAMGIVESICELRDGTDNGWNGEWELVRLATRREMVQKHKGSHVFDPCVEKRANVRMGETLTDRQIALKAPHAWLIGLRSEEQKRDLSL